MVVNRELTREMLKRYGWHIEKMVIVEELSELTKEVCKMERCMGNMNHLIEEMADVYIVLDMIKTVYLITDNELQQMIASKESRNRRRLGDFHD